MLGVFSIRFRWWSFAGTALKRHSFSKSAIPVGSVCRADRLLKVRANTQKIHSSILKSHVYPCVCGGTASSCASITRLCLANWLGATLLTSRLLRKSIPAVVRYTNTADARNKTTVRKREANIRHYAENVELICESVDFSVCNPQRLSQLQKAPNQTTTPSKRSDLLTTRQARVHFSWRLCHTEEPFVRWTFLLTTFTTKHQLSRYVIFNTVLERYKTLCSPLK